jgi:hypothetical protein
MDTFPSWRYGPGDQARIFDCAEDVPKGWQDHPSLVRSPLDRDAKDGPGGSLPGNVMKLKSIAKAEKIDCGEARTAPEYRAAIIAGRTAKRG